MTLFHWSLLYILCLALTFGLSKLCGDSRAGKLSRHAFNALLAFIPAGIEKIRGAK